MSIYMKNIINFINTYSNEPESKMICFNIFNILSCNKKNENYTVNNNGIHFVLNNIPENILESANTYISNFKNMETERLQFENVRETLLTSKTVSYSKSVVSEPENDADNEVVMNWDECNDDCDSLFGEEF